MPKPDFLTQLAQVRELLAWANGETETKPEALTDEEDDDA